MARELDLVLHALRMWLSLCALGLAQGMRHALEPDHLAAVTAMASESRSARRTISYAALWGAGHALMLFVVGGILYLARIEVPEPLVAKLEFAVACVLVVLGVRALWQARARWRRRDQEPATAPPAVAGEAPAPRHAHGALPFAVGTLHGLAGSGALAALLLATQSHIGQGLLMLTVYSLGTVLGMSLLAGVLGRPLQHLSQRRAVHAAMLACAGLLSVVVGALWGFEALYG